MVFFPVNFTSLGWVQPSLERRIAVLTVTRFHEDSCEVKGNTLNSFANQNAVAWAKHLWALPAENPVNGSRFIKKVAGVALHTLHCPLHSVAEWWSDKWDPQQRRGHGEEVEEKGKGNTQKLASWKAGLQDKPCRQGNNGNKNCICI